MPYLGNVPAEAYTNTVKDSFNGDGSTTAFTLSQPSTTNNLRVVVENVIQDPTVAYTVSGTTLTFTSAPPVGTANIYAVHLGPATQTAVPPSEINNATTYTSDLTVQGAFTSVGIDDNATSTAMTLDSSGDVTLTGGIYLGGTGSANLLDDYEEGSWTPVLQFGGSTTGITYATQSGTYTKIGDAVRISAYVNLSNVGTATGIADIIGLPFSVGAGLANLGALSFHLNGIGFNGYFNGWCVNSTSKIQLGTTTDAGSFSFVTNTSFSNTSGIILSGIYKTDA